MEKPLDLRIQKTYIALTNALIEMMEHTSFENIKVKDLCERAMIRKSTFYKHFADKYELLAFVVNEAMRQTDEKFAKKQNESSFEFYTRLISELFNLVRENERLVHSAENSDHFLLILNMLSSQVTLSLREKIKEDRQAGIELPAAPDVMASFFVGAIGESVRQWVMNGRKIPEEDIKAQLCNLVKIIYNSANTPSSI
ncbi:MAG: TetR/AcrR family transcriptional regulator [Eubacteriales bacterium]|nr:TetR/AcrR family transcriptional regulator [Eubacteriales bacterium]